MDQSTLLLDAIRIIGGLSGFVALLWKLYEVRESYLQLDLSTTVQDGHLTAQACLSNRGSTAKKLKWAIFLIGPESEYPAETAREVAKSMTPVPQCIQDLSETDDIQELQDSVGEKRFYSGRKRAIIPVPFFFWEQEDIADEVLKYRCPIDLDSFDPGAYSIRFFVFPEKPKFGPKPELRCTQDLFLKG